MIMPRPQLPRISKVNYVRITVAFNVDPIVESTAIQQTQ